MNYASYNTDTLGEIELRVREAQREDIEGLRKFILKAWDEAGPEAFGWSGASEETISHITTFNFLKELIDNDGVRVFISLDGDEVIGFSTYRGIGDDLVELSGIVVLESRTGIGIGSSLLELTVSMAREDGFSSMVVKTESFNDRAIGFYMSKRFKQGEIVEEDVEGTSVKLMTLRLSL